MVHDAARPSIIPRRACGRVIKTEVRQQLLLQQQCMHGMGQCRSSHCSDCCWCNNADVDQLNRGKTAAAAAAA
jgi:hypothetical protein